MIDPWYIHRASGVTPVISDTAGLTVSFGFTATSGNKLFLFVGINYSLNTPAGWTLVSQAGSISTDDNIGYLFSKTAASDTGVNFIPQGSNNPLVWQVYEAVSTAVIVNSQSTVATTTTFTPMAGLTGNLVVIAALSGSISFYGGPWSESAAWDTGWVEDSDLSAPANPSVGGWQTVAHKLNVATSSVTPSGVFTVNTSPTYDKSRCQIILAINLMIPTFFVGSASISAAHVGTSTVSAIYLGAAQVWARIIATPTIVGSASANANNYGAGSGPSITTPTTTLVGDVTIIVGYVEPINEAKPTASYGVFTLPSGVTLTSGFPIETDAAGLTTGDDHRMYVWYYYATAAGSKTLSFTNTQNIYWGLASATVHGGPTSGSPFADTPVTATISRSASTTTTPSVSLTTAGAKSLVLWAYTDWDGPNSSYPAGFNDVAHASNASGQPAIGSKIYGLAGSTGAVTASRGGADDGMAAALLSLRAP